jgi:hypothetical protein
MARSLWIERHIGLPALMVYQFFYQFDKKNRFGLRRMRYQTTDVLSEFSGHRYVRAYR